MINIFFVWNVPDMSRKITCYRCVNVVFLKDSKIIRLRSVLLFIWWSSPSIGRAIGSFPSNLCPDSWVAAEYSWVFWSQKERWGNRCFGWWFSCFWKRSSLSWVIRKVRRVESILRKSNCLELLVSAAFVCPHTQEAAHATGRSHFE